MKRAIWLILKVVGMLFVILACVNDIRSMAMVSQMTGNYLFLVVCLLVAAVFVYWAYRVIWKPIRAKGA
jgi:hypothetical protein